MVRRLIQWCLLGVLLLPIACSGKAGDPNVNVPQAASLDAWVGESGGGMFVVLEALLKPQDQHNARLTEEDMLRDRLSLEESRQLLRMHLFGTADQLADAGAVSLNDWSFHSFGKTPAALPAREALLWNTALRGLPLPATSDSQLTRRTLLLRGPVGVNVNGDEAAVWRAGELQVDLELRSWSQRERRQFFDQAVKPVPPEPTSEDEES